MVTVAVDMAVSAGAADGETSRTVAAEGAAWDAGDADAPPSPGAENGISRCGFAALVSGTVLAGMDWGVLIAGFPGWTGRVCRMDGGGAAAGCSIGFPLLSGVGVSGFNLIVFLTAEEAEDELAAVGILFKTEVSVLRIFSESISPPSGALVPRSLISYRPFSQPVRLLSEITLCFAEYSMENREGKSFLPKNSVFS